MHAYGSLTTLSGSVTGNKVEATSTGNTREARSFGGGIYAEPSNIVITRGQYTNNQAIATGPGARAEGGAIFMSTTYGTHSLTLDPTAGAITFSGNSVTANGVTTPNAIHFGRFDQALSDTSANTFLTIQDTNTTTNLITIADGITTDINNGKTFTLAQSAGNFLWGGPNLFDSAGGDTVSLTGGSMRLANGFTLDRGALNTTPGSLLAFNVSGGNLKSEGAAASLKNTALSVSSGGKLTVDLGSTLTLDANSTFALNGGTLSFGVDNGNASGKIVSLNTTTAPTFSGSNTLDISDWIHGTYTVLEAETPMASNAAGTFTTFTVGGIAIDPATMRLSAVLNNEDYELQVIAGLNQDSSEKTWGGTAGTWNYTNTNWLPGSSKFVLGDLAKFDGTGAGSPASPMAVTVGAGAGTQVETAGMSITGGSYTFSGGKIVGRTDISQGSVITPTGRLDIAGTGNIVFNNAVDFRGGLWVYAGGSSANITLADYTGGRVVLGNRPTNSRYSGTFSGKLNIQNQTLSGSGSSSYLYGGGLEYYGPASSSISLLPGTLIKNNSITVTDGSGGSLVLGGGVFAGLDILAGTIEGNKAIASHTTQYANAQGGGVIGSIRAC
ncbi:hypothetical protein KL86DPRO_30137 [uncultured delta proteobacterium]|uniref:Uncharacterized protein n=1 Tax=uncultured delta proteobacterium TaxID=34034 RepID=A0A212K872_9DELT|nr:hypothetical protein KL86DPRO_30137 [uncultured delta proteobacterium]